MDMDLRGFLMYHKKNAGGLVSTDAGRSLTDEELRAYCIWGLQNKFNFHRAVLEGYFGEIIRRK